MKWKVWLSLISTLFIGFLLGFIVSRGITVNEWKKTREFATQKGLIRKFDRIVRPDSLQREAITPILIKYGDQLQKQSRQFRLEVRATYDSLVQDVSIHLRPDQIERLEKGKKLMRKRKKKRPVRKNAKQESMHYENHHPHNPDHSGDCCNPCEL